MFDLNTGGHGILAEKAAELWHVNCGGQMSHASRSAFGVLIAISAG
jgi:hypothetical protein